METLAELEGGGCPKLEGSAQPLLPGIANEITLVEISPKLSWRDLCVLATVSRVWRDAICSRQVYNVRVGSNSREKLVLLNYVPSEEFNEIVLFSPRDNFCYALPPIPKSMRKYHSGGGFPQWCQSVSLDGEIYVLGGDYGGSAEVFKFDLAGQGPWKRCANMSETRVAFGCGVMDGKIYAFGGCETCTSEVYDPQRNTWSQIKGMTVWRRRARVETVRGGLFVHGGYFFAGGIFGGGLSSSDDEDDYIREGAKFLQVYSPGEDEWRVMKPFPRRPNRKYFMARGNVHAMSTQNPFRIFVHNADSRSWSYLHKSSFTVFGPVDSISVEPHVVLEVDGELLALVLWRNVQDPETSGYCLLRSNGFGGETRRFTWQKIPVPLYLGDVCPEDFFMSLVEL